MTDRIPLDDMTSDQLDAFYDQRDRAVNALARVRQACASVQAAGKGFTPTKPYDKGAAKAVDWVVGRVLEAIDAHLVNGTPTASAAPTPVPCPACRRADQAGLAASEQHDDCAKEQR